MMRLVPNPAAFHDFRQGNCERAGGCWYDNNPCPILDSIRQRGNHPDIRMGKRRVVCERFMSNHQGREREKAQAEELERQRLAEMHYGGGLF